MVDNDSAVAGTFPINTYVLFLSLLALVFGPYVNLLDLSSLSNMVKLASALVLGLR